LGGEAVYRIGERSVAVISAEGKQSAMSTAQRPVPVPTSNILFGSTMGARKSLSWRVRSQRWCTMIS
jgi:hypothetical protein